MFKVKVLFLFDEYEEALVIKLIDDRMTQLLELDSELDKQEYQTLERLKTNLLNRQGEPPETRNVFAA